MAYRVVITAEAERDLLSILAYIGLDSPRLAVSTTDRIERASLGLGEAALRYALIVGHESSGIRRRIVGSYNIYYRIKTNLVEVLHVLHSARDAEKILFPED